MKFTFKTEKPTGRYRSFDTETHYVKWNKVEIGTISPETPFTIRLRVMKKDMTEDKNPNCPWRWIKLKQQSISLDEAKKYLNDNIKLITDTFTIPTD